MPGFQLTQQLGRARLGRRQGAGELGRGEGTQREQQHPGRIEPRMGALMGKFPGKQRGGARDAGDIAGGLVEGLAQTVGRVCAARVGREIGAEQPALDQTREGEGAFAQMEGLPARDGGEIDRPAGRFRGSRERIAVGGARIAEPIDEREQPLQRGGRQPRFVQRIEDRVEFGRTGCNDGRGVRDFTGQRLDGDFAHGLDDLDEGGFARR